MQSNDTEQSCRIHIIGAGISGLSAALYLLEQDICNIHIYEASLHAGGRCRGFYDKHLSRRIDNGSHLLLQANEHAISLLNMLNIKKNFFAKNSIYHFCEIQQNNIIDKWQYIHLRNKPNSMRFTDILPLSRLLFFPKRYETVADIFCNYNNKFYQRFIEPLCLAALNTAPESASAMLFAKVVRKLLFSPNSMDYLVANTDLGQALIEPILQFISDKGVKIHYRHRLSAITANSHNQIVSLIFAQHPSAIGGNNNDISEMLSITIAPQDLIILAVPVDAAIKLLALPISLQHNKILNAHFLYNHNDIPTLSHNDLPLFIGVIGSAAQWILLKPGIISTTTSDADRSIIAGLTQHEAAKILWNDVSVALSLPQQAMPKYRIINEKKASFAATVHYEQQRPNNITQYNNLVLAGDWLQTNLPATIEGAILSGKKAAHWCLQRLSL